MHDAQAMRRIQRGRDLAHDGQDLGGRQRPAAQATAQALPLQELHDDVGADAWHAVEVEHARDPRVTQARDDLGLVAEAREGVGVRALVPAQGHELDGDLARQAQMAGAPHRAHAAAPDQLRQLVRLADDGAG